MRRSSGYGRGSVWRAFFDPDAWIGMLLIATVWVVFLAALACAVALVRDTTGHDWYATGKLTLTELMIGIGFDDSIVTEYRDWWGEVQSLTRAELRVNGDARIARRHVLRTARQSAELGACCGLGGAVLCLAVFCRRGGRQTPLSAPEPPARPAEDQAKASSEPERVETREYGKGAGRSGTRRKRRKRNYERWI
ncbi:MAG: hypothetical protein OXQ89_05545 [Rhodospirillaceae bacterium]|nr:hypothetical protein [Rhodospirillaceae bacterium]MDD9997190.1 hypothetical protein [Rhodospirillaceae bacterium]